MAPIDVSMRVPEHETIPAARRPRRRTATFAALVAVLASTWAAAPVASAAQTGVVLNSLTSPLALTRIDQIGPSWVRFYVTWPDLQPSPGTWASAWIDQYDKAIRALNPGTHVLFVVFQSPSWETGSSDVNAPPRSAADYAAFLHGLAERFRGRVSAYEIWNEEDLPQFWTGAPDPARYAALLEAAYPAIKSADPSASIVLGGLAGNDAGFLRGVYAAGGKGSFDAVGVHTDTACNTRTPDVYTRDSSGAVTQDSFLGFTLVHQVMLGNGDDKPIWMTELGWTTVQAPCDQGLFKNVTQLGVPPAVQAADIQEAFNCLALYPYVQVGIVYDLLDASSAGGYGLLDPSYTPKPAFDALAAVSRGVAGGAACGSPGKDGAPPGQITATISLAPTASGAGAGPLITFASPRDDVRYSGALPIRLAVSDPLGVGRIMLEIDGRLIRYFGSSTHPPAVTGSLRWQHARWISFGPHTLTLVARDLLGQSTESSLTIVHVHAPGAHRRAGRHH